MPWGEPEAVVHPASPCRHLVCRKWGTIPGGQMCPGNHKPFTGFGRVKTSTFGSIYPSKWPGDPGSHPLPSLVRALAWCRETAPSPTTALPKPGPCLQQWLCAGAPSILRQTCQFAQLRSQFPSPSACNRPFTCSWKALVCLESCC